MEKPSCCWFFGPEIRKQFVVSKNRELHVAIAMEKLYKTLLYMY